MEFESFNHSAPLFSFQNPFFLTEMSCGILQERAVEVLRREIAVVHVPGEREERGGPPEEDHHQQQLQWEEEAEALQKLWRRIR